MIYEKIKQIGRKYIAPVVLASALYLGSATKAESASLITTETKKILVDVAVAKKQEKERIAIETANAKREEEEKENARLEYAKKQKEEGLAKISAERSKKINDAIGLFNEYIQDGRFDYVEQREIYNMLYDAKMYDDTTSALKERTLYRAIEQNISHREGKSDLEKLFNEQGLSVKVDAGAKKSPPFITMGIGLFTVYTLLSIASKRRKSKKDDC